MAFGTPSAPRDPITIASRLEATTAPSAPTSTTGPLRARRGIETCRRRALTARGRAATSSAAPAPPAKTTRATPDSHRPVTFRESPVRPGSRASHPRGHETAEIRGLGVDGVPPV
jgi:hypothetical protein